MAAKKAAAKAARKKTAKGPGGAAKAGAARKGAASARKKAAPRKTAARKAAPRKAARTPGKSAAAERSGISALDVNLGQIFALRPRVTTSFRHQDFRSARHLLRDEAFESIEKAARAVAEKALELTRESSSPKGFKPGR